MKINKTIIKLIAELEYIIGSECYNPNSYNGYTHEEGCDFRYPVWCEYNKVEKRVYGKITNGRYDLKKYQFEKVYPDIASVKYKFGSNHLYIGNALVNLLSFLENRYDIDFNQLEKEYHSKKKSN